MIDFDELGYNMRLIQTQTKLNNYLLEMIPRIVPEVTAWSVLPFKPRTKQLVLLYENTRNYDFFSKPKYFGYNDGFEGLAIQQKTTIINSNFKKAIQDHQLKMVYQANVAVNSVLVQPIINSEKIIGVFSLYFENLADNLNEYTVELSKFAQLVGPNLESSINEGFIDEQSRIVKKSVATADKLVSTLSNLVLYAEWQSSMEMILESIKAVVDYTACGICSYYPKQGKIELEANRNINQYKFERIKFDLEQNPIVDIIVNQTDYLTLKPPGKLLGLGSFRSAIGISLNCGKGHNLALLLLHEQSARYNKYHHEFLKKYASLFTIVCEKRDVEKTFEMTQRKILSGELAPMMAHEIRNLLHSSLNATHDCQEKLNGNGALEDKSENTLIKDEYIKNRIDIIVDGLENTKQIMERYIAVTGKQVLTSGCQYADINETVRKVLTLLKAEAIDKGIEIKVEYSSDDFQINTDWEKVERILANLVLNAIQALSKRQHINVLVKVDKSQTQWPVSIKVIDNGPGISVNHIEKIFDPYYSTKKGGTGLGLAVCKLFTSHLSGKLVVDSVINRGTTFTLYLPQKTEVSHATR